MLAPTAYSEALFPSLRLARSSRIARRVGKALLTMLVASFFLVALAPWQQSVTGSGDVVAFAPGERQQIIEVPVKGRIARWGENIYEMAKVRKGDLIAEIEDVDPDRLIRLERQLEASRSEVKAAQSYLDASRRSKAAVEQVVVSQQAQLDTYRIVKDQQVASAEAAVAAAVNKVEAEKKQLEEFQAALVQIEADYIRQKQLFAEQIVAEVKSQVAERKYREAKAKVAKAEAYVDSAENELIGKKQDRLAKEQEAQVKIDAAIAYLDKSKSDVAKAESEVAKSQASVNKTQKALLEMETKLARQQSQRVEAPFEGYLTRINANQGSRILKEGDMLCEIVPDTADRAVQVWLSGNDAPLVSPGRHVRLQFEGWPAVQFAGWPSVAVGTFGGTVVSVDATDDKETGRFRVFVKPDIESPHTWPDERYLRQGVKAHGWVLLEQVPLWYEIWRNMNGFPPVVTPDGQVRKASTPKLPK